MNVVFTKYSFNWGQHNKVAGLLTVRSEIYTVCNFNEKLRSVLITSIIRLSNTGCHDKYAYRGTACFTFSGCMSNHKRVSYYIKKGLPHMHTWPWPHTYFVPPSAMSLFTMYAKVLMVDPFKPPSPLPVHGRALGHGSCKQLDSIETAGLKSMIFLFRH